MAATLSTDDHFGACILKIWADEAMTIPAKVDGIPVWASADETVLKAMPNADGMGGSVETVAPSPVDAAGVPIPCRITISADADMGAGIKPITIVSEDVIVMPGVPSAKLMSFSFGPATPKA